MAPGGKGILLLNLGGPDTLGAVRPFLYNLFSDRDIIRLGPSLLQKPIAWLISVTRAPKTRSYYKLIGGGSPIAKITGAQAEALQNRLSDCGVRVYVGMRYWSPFISDAIERIRGDGIEECLALSLYPHYSIATTGSAYSEVRRCVERHPMRLVFADPWFDNSLYVAAVANTIEKAADQPGGRLNLLYSAHSLPQSFIDQGDPYVQHIVGTVERVDAELKRRGFSVHSSISYQSRSGPVKWLEPSTEEVIEEMGRRGAGDVVVVPISFVSDHIETLYEVDILYRELAANHGLRLRRAESLNINPDFIDALADVALKSGFL